MKCRVCDSANLEPVLDLGEQPWANHFLLPDEIGKESSYPLRLTVCEQCRVAQLDYTVPKEVMFSDHTYLSGITRTLSAHFEETAKEVDRRFFAGRLAKSVLDIGSNDGTQLKHYQALGYDVLGVESSRTIARIAEESGVPTLNQFFNESTAKGIGRQFDVINASGVFFHLEELHSVTEGIRHCLKPDGVFVVQFLYMKQILLNGGFDQIYHEHLLYYNLETLSALLALHGLGVADASLLPIHGGSIIAYVRHLPVSTSPGLERLLAAERTGKANDPETYREFAARTAVSKRRNLDDLAQRKAAGKRIFGFGAPVKGNTLLNYYGIGPETLDCLVEKNPLRRGLFSPGRHLPVKLENEIDSPPDVYYVLAWNFRDEILRNNRQLLDRGVEFYFPIVPKPIAIDP